MRPYPNKVHPDYNVCNQSTRHGTSIQLIIVHDTEGANIPNSSRDLIGLAEWFDRETTQASAHVGVDGDGNSIRMVDDRSKAWHCAWYNAPSLGIEQVFKLPDQWTSAEYDETARWIALWSRRFDIPIRKGKVTRDGHIVRSGVLRHSELGNLGGGHHDPVGNYDLAEVLRRARVFKQLQDKHADNG